MVVEYYKSLMLKIKSDSVWTACQEGIRSFWYIILHNCFWCKSHANLRLSPEVYKAVSCFSCHSAWLLVFGQLSRIFPAKLRFCFCQPSNRDTGRLPVHEKSSSAMQSVFVHALICLVAAVPPYGQKISRWAGWNPASRGK